MLLFFNLKLFSRVDVPDREEGKAGLGPGLGTLPGPGGRGPEAPPSFQGWSTRLSYFTYFQSIKKDGMIVTLVFAIATVVILTVEVWEPHVRRFIYGYLDRRRAR